MNPNDHAQDLANLDPANHELANRDLLNDESIPTGEYAFPGPLREALVAAIVSGEKTSTSSLLLEYELDDEEPDEPGAKERVLNSQGEVVCVTEDCAVAVIPFGAIPLEHAIAEGEGFRTVAEWQAAHREFWESKEFRDSLTEAGYPNAQDFTVTDDTLVVCTTFRVIAAR